MGADTYRAGQTTESSCTPQGLAGTSPQSAAEHADPALRKHLAHFSTEIIPLLLEKSSLYRLQCCQVIKFRTTSWPSRSAHPETNSPCDSFRGLPDSIVMMVAMSSSWSSTNSYLQACSAERREMAKQSIGLPKTHNKVTVGMLLQNSSGTRVQATCSGTHSTLTCDPELELASHHLRITLERSFATLLFHSGNADWAAAMAADVSLPFMLATVATTSPVAGFFTCKQPCTAE